MMPMAGQQPVPVWRKRVGSILLVFAAVLLMLLAFAAQVVLTGAETIHRPADAVCRRCRDRRRLALGRLLPAAALFGALYLDLLCADPAALSRCCAARMWPGALVTTLVWVGTTMGMPRVLAQFAQLHASPMARWPG